MSVARSLVSISLLSATLLYLHFFTSAEEVAIRRPLDGLPMAVAGWKGAESAVLGEDELELLKPTDYVLRRYVDATGQSLWLYVGYWGTQRKQAQIHSPKNCLPGGGWEPLEVDRLPIPLANSGASIEVNRYVLQKDQDRQVVFYWYASQGRVTASEVQAKIELVRGAILRNRSDGAVVRVSSMVPRNSAETSDSLVKFVQAIYPMLGEFLPS